MQAVVDYRGWFMDAYIGWPGKVHDARVLVNSSLYRKAMSGTLLPDWKRTISGVQVPLVVLGDPAYPALPWLMKPYPETAQITAEERRFNYRQSRARMTVENAFGRLKGRWRCLLKRMDCHLSNVPNIVASCVVLHNMCKMFGDHCDNEWIHHKGPTTPVQVQMQFATPLKTSLITETILVLSNSSTLLCSYIYEVTNETDVDEVMM